MRKLLKYLLNDFYCNEQTSFPSDVFLCEYRTQFYHTTIHKALDRLLLKNIRQKSLCKGLCTAVSRAVQTCTVLRAVSWRKQGRKRKTKGWVTNGLLNKLYHARQEDIWILVLMHGQCCTQSTHHFLKANIFPSGPPTQSISTYYLLTNKISHTTVPWILGRSSWNNCWKKNLNGLIGKSKIVACSRNK